LIGGDTRVEANVDSPAPIAADRSVPAVTPDRCVTADRRVASIRRNLATAVGRKENNPKVIAQDRSAAAQTAEKRDRDAT
jgi:hypothetical protein